MALQSTGAISINDIRLELGQSQTNSSLRTLSSLAGKSAPDAMSEFYGFSAATAYTFYMGDGQQGYEDSEQACSEAYDPITLYSSDTSLSTGVELYTDNTLTTSFAGQDLWYKYGTNVYAIDNRGVITGVRSC